MEYIEELIEMKNIILEVRNKLELYFPKKILLSQLSITLNTSRQTLLYFLQTNYEYNIDYWKENGKILVSEKVAFEIIRRYKK